MTHSILNFPNFITRLIAALVVAGSLSLSPTPISASTIKMGSLAIQPPCENPGWFPTEFGLKDHSIFWHDGYYYLISINLPNESYFVYGRSKDLCEWENLTPTMAERIPGAWDELVIWPPYVYEEDGIYYLFYTGVKRDFTQSIMLATSTNPADPDSWQPEGMIFQPDHVGMVYQVGEWADCRDATIFKLGNTYYMYYTGLDTNGGIIGVATASSPLGPWYDWGATLTLNSQPLSIAESPTGVDYNGLYYLLYHDTQNGEHYRIGATPAGPWSQAYPLSPGWAHEIWKDQEGNTFTSFLTDYTVTIAPISWDTIFDPPRLIIGTNINHQFLPVLLR